jgi:hypothetical protein
MGCVTLVSASRCGLLPWHRWHERAIWVLPPIALLQVLLAGAVLDDSMEYYGLFLPLAFVFVGWVYSVRGTILYAALTMVAGMLAIGFGAETRDVTPFFLLGVAISIACGVVVAVGRRTEARTIDAMGQLMEAAILLGAARTERRSPRSCAAPCNDWWEQTRPRSSWTTPGLPRRLTPGPAHTGPVHRRPPERHHHGVVR